MLPIFVCIFSTAHYFFIKKVIPYLPTTKSQLSCLSGAATSILFMPTTMKVVEHFGRVRNVDYWELETVMKGWDGLRKDSLPMLVTCTTYDDETEDSWHNSRVGNSWRICHNKLLDGTVFKSLSV